MTILTASALTKSFGPHTVLDGIDVSIHQGERVGLVGKNGCGKSTLARILAGEETPDSGELAVRRDAQVMYLAQEPQLAADRSALETVLRGLAPWWEAKQRHEQASQQLAQGHGDLDAALARQGEALASLERLGGFDVSHRALALLSSLSVFDPERQVGTLSGGERRRVALARLLLSAPDLAILDEPTNHLDLGAIEWLESYLADQYAGAVLLITHDRYFLDAVVDRTIEIEQGQLYGYEGGFADYLQGKAERIALAERTEQNRQNFLRRELDWLRRSPPARTTKQQARIQRAQQALSNRPAAKAKQLALEVAQARTGKSILDLEQVWIETPAGAATPRTLIRDLTLHLTQGEKLGIVGPNGVGKSTLLKAALGEHPLARGRIALGKNTRIAYLSQHRTGLDEDKSVLDNVAEGRSHVRVGDRDVHAISYLERFLFGGADLRKPVKALSGGERTRVALAKLFQQQTSLLLLDEPTNDLDLDTLAALEGLLLEQDITTLVVTHDRWFLDRIATSILWFQGDGQVTRFAGNYSSVRELLDQQAKDAAKERAARKPKPAAAPSKGNKKPGLSYKEAQELTQIETRIAELEALLGELDQTLSDPDVYQTRAEEVSALVARRDQARADADGLMERWAELSEKQAQG